MASKKITAMPDWGGNQVSTDLMTGVDLSEPDATKNQKTTLNDLFSIITKNITDGAVRFQGFAAPSVPGAGEGALYFDSTSNTFKGSRNASAFENLLFGNGTSQQVAVYSSVVDRINGFSTFTYNDTTTRLFVSSPSSFTPTVEVGFNSATVPKRITLLGGQGIGSIYSFDSGTPGSPPILNFYRGNTGPALPVNGQDIGSLRFRPALTTGDTPTTVGGARIDIRATENAVIGTGGGVGLTIYTAANGEVADTQRFLINQNGVVAVGVNAATITTNFNTNTRIVLGELTTYDSDAIIQMGNPFSGNDNKIVVIQGRSGQTKPLTEWQTSAGAFLFSIGAAGSHSYGGTTGIAVSAAGQGRIYFDSAGNKFKVSQNGGAYQDLITSPGGTAKSIQYTAGGGAFDGDNYFLWDSPSATLEMGSASVLSGKILLRNSTNANTLTIQPGATASNITFTLPVNTGTSGQFLQTNGAGVLTWATAGGGGLTVDTTTITGGTAGRVFYHKSGDVLGEIPGSSVTAQGALSFTPTARTSGNPALPFAQFLSAADTGLSNVEQIAFQFGGDASQATVTRTLAGGGAAITTWRNSLFVAPTISAPSAQTITTAATLAISGAPVAAGSVTITNPYALVTSGGVRLQTSSGSEPVFTIVNSTGQIQINVPTGNPKVSLRYLDVEKATWDIGNATYTYGTGGGGAKIQTNAIGTDRINGFTGATVLVTDATSGLATAQLQVVSGSASRVGLRVDSANNSTVALNQFYLNADDTVTVAMHSTFAVDSNGTPGNGFGGQLSLQLESSTTEKQDAAAINWVWADATHTTRTAKFQFQLVGNAAALATVAEFDMDTTAGNTRFLIYDVDNATLERVSVGAADSGGGGFKVLRIPN